MRSTRFLSKKTFRKALFTISIIIDIVAIPILIYMLVYYGRIYPNIFVANVPLGKLKPDAATLLLSQKITTPEKIKLISGTQSFDLYPKNIDIMYSFSESVDRAFNLTRTGNLVYDFQDRIKLFFSKKEIGLSLTYNQSKLDKYLSIIAGQISVDPIYPSAKIVDGQIVVNRGRAGTTVDSNLLKAKIGRNLSFVNSSDIEIPTRQISPELNEQEAENYKKRLEKYIGKTIEIKFEYNTYVYKDTDLITLIDAKNKYKDDLVSEIVNKITKSTNREPQNPKFNFQDGKVTEFLPATDGIIVKNEELKSLIENALDTLESSENKSTNIDIPVTRISPDVTTDKVNDLGIKEVIGRGTSRFRGSIPSRVHNVTLAASKLNGILIKPGETLSFNDSLGDVSKFTGYQEAYIIQDGKTVLGDGGGVCQVSTTLFRAALNAGLPILERQAHAYRVGYYEQGSPPGLDATVYGPSPDLKIKNDTSAHILIQAIADTKTYSLVFELYGTKDGRVSTITKPVISDVISAGDDIYIDDPSLPTGTVKQTEHRANGAKVTFGYTVTRNGEVIYKKNFISTYKPWPAVYLRGTKSF